MTCFEGGGARKLSDRLQERLFEIALALLEEAGYLTLEGLAQRAGVSKRTVQHDLERLEAWLEDEGLSERITLVKKSGSGVCLVCTDESKKEAAELFGSHLQKNRTNDNYERRLEVAKFLLFSHDDLTIQFLADQFYVSKSVIQKDLTWVNKWLLQYGLAVSKRQNRGVGIYGSEANRRLAIASLVELSGSRGGEDARAFGLAENINILRVDLAAFYNGLNRCPRADVGRIAEIIQNAENRYDFFLMDSYYTALLVHLAIAVERLLSGQGVSASDYPENLLTTPEGEIANEIADELETAFQLKVPESERAFICMHIMGAHITGGQSLLEEDAGDTHSRRIGAFTQCVVTLVEQATGLRFSQDDLLLLGLAMHVKTSVYRLKSGLAKPARRAAASRRGHPAIYRAVWASGYFYRLFFHVTPTEEELSSVCLHFLHSLYRRKRRLRALLVYRSGIAEAEDMLERAHELEDDVDIQDICVVGQLFMKELSSYDLIISAAEIAGEGTPVIHVSRKITDEEIGRIRAFACARRQEMFLLEERQFQSDAQIVWVTMTHKTMEAVFESVFDLLMRRGFSSAALSRESLEIERSGRSVLIGDTGYTALYLHDAHDFCAYGVRLTAPIAFEDGMASRVLFLLMGEERPLPEWEDEGYASFICQVFRAADREKEKEGAAH